MFGKRHADVLRVIEKGLDCSPEFRKRNFALTYHRTKVGAAERNLPAYNMTKDGFVFLVMGFTGKENTGHRLRAEYGVAA